MDWVHLKQNLDPIPCVKRNTSNIWFCSCVLTGCEQGRLGGQVAPVGTALLGTGLAQVAAAEDLPCSISEVLFCSSGNSIYFYHVHSVLAFCLLLFYPQNPWLESRRNAVKSSKLQWDAAYSFTGWFLFFLVPAVWFWGPGKCTKRHLRSPEISAEIWDFWSVMRSIGLGTSPEDLHKAEQEEAVMWGWLERAQGSSLSFSWPHGAGVGVWVSWLWGFCEGGITSPFWAEACS